MEEACGTLAKKGGAHESEPKKIVIGPGFVGVESELRSSPCGPV